MQNNKIKPFIIVGTQRTGSSMVAATLHDHPKINCGWEWTLHMPFFRKIALVATGLKGRFKDLPEPHSSMMIKKTGVSTIGFRLLFSSSPKWIITPRFNLANYAERLDGFIRFIRNRPDIKIIHIIRDDQIAWLASLFMAKYSKIYIQKEYPRELKINIPIKEALKRIQAKCMLEQKLRSIEQSNPYLELKYEKIVSNRNMIFKQLFHFLNIAISGKIPESPIKKQQKRPLKKIITNFENLSQNIKKLEL